MDYVYIVIVIAMIEYSVMILVVGATRVKFGVLPPEVKGNQTWDRLYRIQVNTAEQLVLFIPSLLLFATTVSPLWAARLGCVFLVGRIVYALTYLRDPRTRIPGAILSSFTSYFFVLGSAVALVKGIL